MQAQALHPKNVDSIKDDIREYEDLCFPAELARLQSCGNGEWSLYPSMCRTVPWNEPDFSLFDWWLPRRDELPTLAPAALATLATPTHSMDVERIFSRLGIILTPQRTSMSKENKWSHLSFAVHGDVLHKLQ